MNRPESVRLASGDVVAPAFANPTPLCVSVVGGPSIEEARTLKRVPEEQGSSAPVAALVAVPQSDASEQIGTTSGIGRKKMVLLDVKPLRVFADIFLLFLVWLPTILFATVGHPFERGFYCDDESIRYPYKDNSVPNWLLYLFGALFPIISIITIETFRVLKFEPQFYKKVCIDPLHEFRGKPVHPLLSNLYQYIGYFAFGAALCQGLTDLGKYTVGRMRPHFYDVCKPAVDCAKLPPYFYVTEPNCQTTDFATLREARLSFPSGHSSFGAYTMFFLVMYIHARLVWPMVSLLVKHVLQNICVVMGVACALSRISDYKHHWSDVLAGVVLGILVACLTTFHMLGLFRQPHFIFSHPSYLAVPSTEYSFGGDQFHNATEIRFVEQRFQEQNINLKDLQQLQMTKAMQHKTENGGV